MGRGTDVEWLVVIITEAPRLQSGALSSTRQYPRSVPGHNCTSWLADVQEKPCLISKGRCSVVSGRSHLILLLHCQASALDPGATHGMGEVWEVRRVWFPDQGFPSKSAKVTFHLKNLVIHAKRDAKGDELGCRSCGCKHRCWEKLTWCWKTAFFFPFPLRNSSPPLVTRISGVEQKVCRQTAGV